MSVELKPIMDALRKLAADTTIDLAGKLYNADLQIKSWSAQAASDGPALFKRLRGRLPRKGLTITGTQSVISLGSRSMLLNHRSVIPIGRAIILNGNWHRLWHPIPRNWVPSIATERDAKARISK